MPLPLLFAAQAGGTSHGDGGSPYLLRPGRPWLGDLARRIRSDDIASECKRPVNHSDWLALDTGEQDRTYCCDWLNSGPVSLGATIQEANLRPTDFVSVLAFQPVGLTLGKDNGRRVVSLNDLGIDSFLAHYDNGFKWYKQQWWYSLVKKHVVYKELVKSRYLSHALLNKYVGVFSLYSHVWLLDEDVMFPPAHHVRRFISTAVRLNAMIAQPAVEGSSWQFVHPNEDCAVRQTNFVEIQIPLLRTQVARHVFTELFHPNATSDWGLDVTWCGYLARRYGDQHPACVIVNSGGFTKKNSHASNYSRDDAIMEEACMRREYSNVLAKNPKQLACVDDTLPMARLSAPESEVISDKEPQRPRLLDAQLWPLRNVFDSNLAEQLATGTLAPDGYTIRRLRMYVYDLAVQGGGYLPTHCMKPEDFGEVSDASNFQFESHLETALRGLADVVKDPADADFFFLPACLSQFWASKWKWDEGGDITTSCPSCLRDYEIALIDAMRKVGPWYDDHPQRHLVARHICPTINEMDWMIGAGMHQAFPILWHDDKLKYACVETHLPRLLAEYNMTRDNVREVQVPYYVDLTRKMLPLPAAEKRRDVGFVGSACNKCAREWIAQELDPGAIYEVHRTEGKQNYVHEATRNADEILAEVRATRFELEPHGDTQERRQIYEAMLAGTPVLFPDHVQLPLRMWDWYGAGIESCAAPELRNDYRRRPSENQSSTQRPTTRTTSVQLALRDYDKFMEGFEQAREPFLWGTRAFSSHLMFTLHKAFFVPRWEEDDSLQGRTWEKRLMRRRLQADEADDPTGTLGSWEVDRNIGEAPRRWISAAAAAEVGLAPGRSRTLLEDEEKLAPRVLLTLSCSESSATIRLAEQLLSAARVPTSLSGCTDNGTAACDSEILWHLKPSSQLQNQTGPILDANASIKNAVSAWRKQGRALLTKSTYHAGDYRTAHGPEAQGLNALKSVGAQTAAAVRCNPLARMTCLVRDCMFRMVPRDADTEAKFYAQFPNGTRSSACFQRRELPNELQPKAHLSPEASIAWMRDNLHEEADDTDDGSVACTEDLLAFEYSEEEDDLQRSVDAWRRLLNAWRASPGEDAAVADVLIRWRSDAGVREAPPIRDAIANAGKLERTLRADAPDLLWTLEGPTARRRLLRKGATASGAGAALTPPSALASARRGAHSSRSS